VLRLPTRIAPIKVGVTPLVDKEPLKQFARRVYETLKERHYVLYLEGGTIGKKYALADELGIPFVVTVDYDSISNNDVTVRDRDSRKQIRVPFNDLLRVIDLGLSNYDIFSIGYPVIEYYS
ncbi:MAG: His/Gly/Thr/Pro-type tRNA ligase C-terminal domain-containing protein, partial [Ignisphaera sp.]